MAFVASLSLSPLRTSPFVASSSTGSSASSRHYSITSCSSPTQRSPTHSRRSILSLAAALTLAITLPQPVKADRTLASAKRAYDRYAPRILQGHESLMNIRGAVAEGSPQEVVGKMLEDKEFSRRWRRAMDIYAGSFSDNYVSGTTRDLRKRIDLIFKDLEKLRTTGGEEGKDIWVQLVEQLQGYAKDAKLPGLVEGLAI